jgi:hypothetical protein
MAAVLCRSAPGKRHGSADIPEVSPDRKALTRSTDGIAVGLTDDLRDEAVRIQSPLSIPSLDVRGERLRPGSAPPAWHAIRNFRIISPKDFRILA